MPLTHRFFAVGLTGLDALLAGCGNTAHALNAPSDQVGSPGDGKVGKEGKADEHKEKDELSRAAEVAERTRIRACAAVLEIATLKTAHDFAAAEGQRDAERLGLLRRPAVRPPPEVGHQLCD